MEEERQELDFDLDLNEDPFNPKKSKSGLIKGIIAAVAAVVLIAMYFYLVGGN